MGHLVSSIFLLGLAAYLFHGGLARWIAKTAKAVDPMVVGLPTGFVGYLVLRSVFGDREVTGVAARLIAGFYFLMGVGFLAAGGLMLWFGLMDMFPQHFGAASSSKAKAEVVEGSTSTRFSQPATEAEKARRWTPVPPPAEVADEIPPVGTPMRREASAALLPSLPEVPVTSVAAIVPAPAPQVRVKEDGGGRVRVAAKKPARRGAAAAPVDEVLPPGVQRMSKNWCPPGIERSSL